MRFGPFAALFALAGLVARPAAAQSTRPAAGSRPNVVVILADDMGFSDLGCYGGEIKTPNLDRLASQGVRFTQFYNRARCCPTRASLMTGLYPHQAGIGAMNQDLGTPAYQGELNDRCVTLAEVLKTAGYRTGMVGKWHLVHLSIASAPGPQQKAMLRFDSDAPISPTKDNWPVNRGFEQHWGTIPGVDSYFDPYGLVHNLTPIKPDKKDFYYTDFITDHAVKMIEEFGAPPAGSAAADPFFLYVAYTAPHWPMQARPEDIAHYDNAYTAGWDALRETRFQRQIRLGIVDEKWGLSPRAYNTGLNDGPSVVGPWADAPEKAWQARRMAVYAAMVENLDRGVGTILKTLADRNLDQNTLVLFLSDNGGCQENVQPFWYDIPGQTRDGRTIEVGNKAAFMPGPETVYQSYGPAWANASNTPFRKFKHFTEEGGISAPFIARWPAVIAQGGTNGGRIERRQVGDVIDFMPTLVEAAGATYPTTFHGNPIPPMEGKSLIPALTGGSIDRGAMFWEHEGNRAVRLGDWKLVAPDRERWQLFNIAEDRTELHDRSAEHPEKVAELKDLYARWAARVGVRPWPVK